MKQTEEKDIHKKISAVLLWGAYLSGLFIITGLALCFFPAAAALGDKLIKNGIFLLLSVPAAKLAFLGFTFLRLKKYRRFAAAAAALFLFAVAFVI